MSGFRGKAVIVTGSSSGIGECAATYFARHGCNVALIGRNLERLEEARQKCQNLAQKSGFHDSKFITIAGDITARPTRDKLLVATIEAFGKLDILVVNHGCVAENDNFEDITEEDFDTVMNTNLKSALFLIKSATQHLEATKGSIVCVSSMISQAPTRSFILAYSLSKVALDHLVKTLALELGPKGIRVNSVNPTYVKTRFSRVFNEYADETSERLRSIFGNATPLRDRFDEATAEDQAEVIGFLASDASRFVSGVCVPVDGGLLCRGNPINFPQCEDN